MSNSVQGFEHSDPRIDQMRINGWIGYDRAISIRSQLDALFRHPRTHRMPNLALISDSNNGKTMILMNFCRRANPPVDPLADKSILPVLMIDTPPAPDEGRLYYAILERLCAEGSAREPDDSKCRRIKIILDQLETRMLILDDFFNIGAGSPTRKRQFLNALRSLSNKLQMPIVVSGTEETLNALSVDPSISNRFKPVFLPKWNNARLVEFARFVKSLEPSLLLKQECQLMSPDTLNNLLFFSEGLIGEVVEILRVLSAYAIVTGSESITGDMVTLDKLKSLGWVPPSDRSRHLANS